MVLTVHLLMWYYFIELTYLYVSPLINVLCQVFILFFPFVKGTKGQLAKRHSLGVSYVTIWVHYQTLATLVRWPLKRREQSVTIAPLKWDPKGVLSQGIWFTKSSCDANKFESDHVRRDGVPPRGGARKFG